MTGFSFRDIGVGTGLAAGTSGVTATMAPLEELEERITRVFHAFKPAVCYF